MAADLLGVAKTEVCVTNGTVNLPDCQLSIARLHLLFDVDLRVQMHLDNGPFVTVLTMVFRGSHLRTAGAAPDPFPDSFIDPFAAGAATPPALAAFVASPAAGGSPALSSTKIPWPVPRNNSSILRLRQ